MKGIDSKYRFSKKFEYELTDAKLSYFVNGTEQSSYPLTPEYISNDEYSVKYEIEVEEEI